MSLCEFFNCCLHLVHLLARIMSLLHLTFTDIMNLVASADQTSHIVLILEYHLHRECDDTAAALVNVIRSPQRLSPRFSRSSLSMLINISSRFLYSCSSFLS